MSELVVGQEANAQSARAHALAVLRIRSSATGLALLPAAVAAVLVAGEVTGSVGAGWDGLRLAVLCVAAVVLVFAVTVGVVIARARPAITPTVPLEERSAPDLYNLVRDLAERLGVPAPSAVALTPDCDSWLEDRTHRAFTGGGRSARGAAPVLVIGSPFLWWMRVAELRALLAPVVAGTGPSAHPDIAHARRFVRGLDAAVAAADRAPVALVAPAYRLVGGCARLMLRSVAPHAAEMERGVAMAASERAQHVDQGLRTVAQEQVGLAYAGWDRLLTRVALPAWRAGRWPSRLDSGVVSALTELSRRDRLAEGFASRLGERPACDLLEDPGAADEAVSLLAAQLFHAGDREPGPDWAPVDWQAYPEEVVDRIWRSEASRLFRALDDLDGLPRGGSLVQESGAFAESRAGEYARARADSPGFRSDAHGSGGSYAEERCPSAVGHVRHGPHGPHDLPPVQGVGATAAGAAGAGSGTGGALCGPTLARVMERLAPGSGSSEELAARVAASAAREETPGSGLLIPGTGDGLASPMGLPLPPRRSGEELLVEHLSAAVCCAAVDNAGASPGLDWLDGPVLLVDGVRRADLSDRVLTLVEDGDDQPLRDWLSAAGVRPEKPVRLV